MRSLEERVERSPAVVGIQQCGGRATGLTDGDTLFGEGIDGACGGVTTESMANDFTPFVIFLVVKGEGGIRSMVQVCLGCSGGVEFVVPDCEGNMAQAQGVVVRGMAIFTGAQQEEEGNPDHLDGGGEFGHGGGVD